MSRYERPPPATSESMEARRQQLMATQKEENLPEYAERVASDPKIAAWIADQEARMLAAIRDTDDVLFDKAVSAWQKATVRVNELIADDYYTKNPDPELWDLRYLKWMTKVVSIHFTSPLGDFHVYPRHPRGPRVKRWYTADELINMLHPGVAAVINMTGQLPIRPEEIPRARPGENILKVDLTGPEPVIKYELPGGPRYDGKGVR